MSLSCSCFQAVRLVNFDDLMKKNEITFMKYDQYINIRNRRKHNYYDVCVCVCYTSLARQCPSCNQRQYATVGGKERKREREIDILGLRRDITVIVN